MLQDSWNLFDFIVVIISTVAMYVSAFPGVSLLRLIRVVRVLRLFKQMQVSDGNEW